MRFLSQKLKMTLFIRYFGLMKVPMIFYCKPSVIEISSKSVTLKIPFIRRNRNHLGSMYLGALCVGADITSALLSLSIIKESGKNILPIFKDFKADYYKRAEGDVHFVCNQGDEIQNMIEEVIQNKVRINKKIDVLAYVPSKLNEEVVAKFSLTLSLKEY